VEPRVSYALVGLFVLVLGAAFVFASLWIVGVGPAGDTRSYHVYLEESVAGLTVESLVKYQGVDVGKIRSIDIDPEDPGRVRLLIQVGADVPVNADTVASLATQGLTGLLYYIELRGGGPDSPPLTTAPGRNYPVIPSEPSFGARLQEEGFAMLGDAKRVMGDLGTTLDALRRLLGEENREAVSATLRDAARTAERLSGAADALGEDLERLKPILDDLGRAAADLPGLAERAGTTLDAAEAAAGEVRRAAEGLDALVTQAAPDLLALTRDGLPQVSPLLRDLRELTARLDRLAADLERDPALLLHGRARRPGPGER
jgi:phospholipid/cholesterol/gamma-HCH transport system substrate-binding protein